LAKKSRVEPETIGALGYGWEKKLAPLAGLNGAVFRVTDGNMREVDSGHLHLHVSRSATKKWLGWV